MERAMPDILAEREQGFEAKWAHDAEMGFKVAAREAGMLGNWAARLLGLSGFDAQNYANRLVALATLTKKDGEDPVAARLRADFTAHNVALDENALHAIRAEFLDVAKKELGALHEP